jgi:hypothetical protein
MDLRQQESEISLERQRWVVGSHVADESGKGIEAFSATRPLLPIPEKSHGQWNYGDGELIFAWRQESDAAESLSRLEYNSRRVLSRHEQI